MVKREERIENCPFSVGFGSLREDDNGKSPWIPSLCLSDFLAVDVGLVLTSNHQDLKEEKFPPAALGPAGFKGGEVFPSEGSLRVCSAPTEQGHGVCVSHRAGTLCVCPWVSPPACLEWNYR